MEFLSKLKIKEGTFDRIDSAVKGRDHNKQALDDIKELEEKLKRVQYSWEKGLLNPDDYLRKNHYIQQEIASMKPLDYDRMEEAVDLITYFPLYWERCLEVPNPEEARQQLLTKIVDRVFVYDDHVIAIALPEEFGIILNQKESDSQEIVTAVTEYAGLEAKGASAFLDACTQSGSDGT